VSTFVAALRSQLTARVVGYSCPHWSRASEANWLLVSEDSPCHVCDGPPKPTGSSCLRILVATFVTALRSQLTAGVVGYSCPHWSRHYKSQLAPRVVGYSCPHSWRHSEANWLLVSEDTRVHIGHGPPKPTGSWCRRILVATFVTALRSQLAPLVLGYSLPRLLRPSEAN